MSLSKSQVDISFAKIPFLFVKAAGVIISDRKLLTLCLIPWAIALMLFGGSFFLLIANHNELTGWLFGQSAAWYAFVFDVIAFLLEIVIAAIIALLVTLVLADIFIESFVIKVFKKLGSSIDLEPRGTSFVGGVLWALADNLKRLLYLGLISIVLFVFAWFPPLLVVVLFLSFFLAGLDSLDLPLQLKGLSFPERLAFARKQPLVTVVLGACYLALLMIPVLGLLSLPLAYFVAVGIIEGTVHELPASKCSEERRN